MFKPTFQNFGLSFTDINNVKLLKWTINFINELESYKIRKVSIDNVMLNLNNRRKISY